MKIYVLSLLLFFAFWGCEKPCDKSLRIGEMTQIPVQFVGFTLPEINDIVVYRFNKSNPTIIDTFYLKQILRSHEAISTSEIISDYVPNHVLDSFGYYKSYFDNCNLIFDWQTRRDTLSDFEIKKSKGLSNDCHKNDLNVQIDRLSFNFNGKTISKNETIQIIK